MKYETFETKDMNPQTVTKALNLYGAAGWTLNQVVPIAKKNGMTNSCPTDRYLLVFSAAA